MKKVAIAYLRQREWSMGSGQCPDCCGMKTDFGCGTDNIWKDSPKGHERECPLAIALTGLGESPLMLPKKEEIARLIYLDGTWEDVPYSGGNRMVIPVLHRKDRVFTPQTDSWLPDSTIYYFMEEREDYR